MLKSLKVAVPVVALATCVVCGESQSYEQGRDLEFFNPLYGMPESDFAYSCVVDVKISAMKEEAFLATLDRITEDTGNGIMYSSPDKRDRVAYIVPVDCDEIETENAFSPHNYFDIVSNVTKTRAGEYPFLFRLADYNPQRKLVADLNNAAFAAELAFAQLSSEEEMQRQWGDFFCIQNANIKAQTQYGLPLTYIMVRDSSLLYIYNTYPVNSDLVYYLVERGFDECGVKFRFKVRKLNTVEMDELSINFVQHP
jgi:hypothetical protein